MLKRAFDLSVSAVALFMLAPLFVLLAAIVVLDSKGSVFYRGIRTGQGGRNFRMFKFRTMYESSKNLPDGTTGKNDPRITRAGKVLRRFKLDELPQLINVFVGEMSLVGPRPELPRYTDLYQGEEKIILSVRPGITDFSSLEFSSLEEVVGSSEVDSNYEQRVLPRKNRLRIKYVKEANFLVDLKILFDTVLVILKKL